MAQQQAVQFHVVCDRCGDRRRLPLTEGELDDFAGALADVGIGRPTGGPSHFVGRAHVQCLARALARTAGFVELNTRELAQPLKHLCHPCAVECGGVSNGDAWNEVHHVRR